MRLCKDPKELAVLHNNKAACHLKAGRWKDAVKECTNALRADDTLMKARLRRAKAFERGNMVREAFEDYHVINATDLKTHETQQAEARLGGILNAAANRAANGAPAARQQPPPAIQFKFCLDDDIRVVRFGGGSVPSYAYLLDIAHSKYSEVTEPFKLSYKDGEGQLITIRESEDVNVAMTPVVTMLRAAAAQGDHGPKLPAHLVVKFFLTKVPESEVPAPPEAEVEELRRFKEQQATFYKLLQERIAEQERLEAAGQAQGEQSAAMGLDEWILQFAQLFRDATNIDFDRHIDLNSLGQEKLSAAMNASLNSEQAEPLFQEAILKFKEQISMGIYNWGQALATIARKHLDGERSDCWGTNRLLGEAVFPWLGELTHTHTHSIQAIAPSYLYTLFISTIFFSLLPRRRRQGESRGRPEGVPGAPRMEEGARLFRPGRGQV